MVGNSGNVIHEGRAKFTCADLDARDALMARLLEERGGREALDIVSQLRIEDYATAQIQLGKVTRRLEALGAVSAAGNERRSLVATYTTFSARAERLAAELPPVTAHTPTLSGIDTMSQDACELAEALLLRLKAGEQLSAFDQGRLAVLELAMRGVVRLPSGETIKVIRTIVDPVVDGKAPSPADSPVRAEHTTASAEAEPEPACCEYCYQRLADGRGIVRR